MWAHPFERDGLIMLTRSHAQFNPEYVTQGRRGGVRLAERFVKDVRKYIDNIDPAAGRRADIRIRVYANVVGLSKAYRHAGIIPEGQDLTDFVRGFNAGHENCDFVDVGPGPELADKKIIGWWHPLE